MRLRGKTRAVVNLLLTLTLGLIVYAPVYAQTDSVVVKPCEDALDELRVRRVEVLGLQEQIRLLLDQSKVKDQLIANLDATAVFWREAATARKEALSVDDRVEDIRLLQIGEYKEEIARLRTENDKLRRSRDKRFLIGTIIGTAVGGFIFK